MISNNHFESLVENKQLSIDEGLADIVERNCQGIYSNMFLTEVCIDQADEGPHVYMALSSVRVPENFYETRQTLNFCLILFGRVLNQYYLFLKISNLIIFQHVFHCFLEGHIWGVAQPLLKQMTLLVTSFSLWGGAGFSSLPAAQPRSAHDAAPQSDWSPTRGF